MTEWKPIDTHPGTFEDVLLFMEWDHNGQTYNAIDIGSRYKDRWELRYYETEPSHWMPLPKPPVKEHICANSHIRITSIGGELKLLFNDDNLGWVPLKGKVNFCPICGESK